jgi:hypothetical protein
MTIDRPPKGPALFADQNDRGRRYQNASAQMYRTSQ